MRYEFRADRVVDLSQQLEPGIPRPVGFPDPELTVFRTIASGDVINVDKIGATRCFLVGAPLKIRGGYASPLRVLALV